ncbi:MAG: winged helix-turn-helix transcriptional regulator [Chloroflexi bacterium]|nr:winged helix-turn-helix transcriptional regulator [Chloroflexota bacterium]
MVTRSTATAIGQPAAGTDLIVMLLAKLSQALRSSVWQQGKRSNLTPTQVRTLVYLSDSTPEKRTLSALARSHGIALPTATGIVDALVRRNLVTREPNPGDRRSVILQLTAEGERIRREIVGWEATIQHIVDSLPSDRRDALLHTLKDIIASLRPVRHDQADRVCYTCDHFHPNAHPGDERAHHCTSLDQHLSVSLAVSEWPPCLSA